MKCYSINQIKFVLPMAAAVLALSASAAPKWNMVWNDEFDGTKIDREKWDFDLGTGFYTEDRQFIGGWGNAEKQSYTDSAENAYVENGLLHLQAVKKRQDNRNYTSARIRSSKPDGTPLFVKKYGRFEIRAKLPLGKGLWPAIWLLPADNCYGVWAASGEIDIMEARGQNPQEVLGTIHYGSRWPKQRHSGKTFVFRGSDNIADFHVYAIEWEPDEIRWFVDGRKYSEADFWWSSSRTENSKGILPVSEEELNTWPAPFDQPFYLIMNLAVGGQFLGDPDDSTPFPSEMLIDYVRVYDKADGYRKPSSRGPGKLPF